MSNLRIFVQVFICPHLKYILRIFHKKKIAQKLLLLAQISRKWYDFRDPYKIIVLISCNVERVSRELLLIRFRHKQLLWEVCLYIQLTLRNILILNRIILGLDVGYNTIYNRIILSCSKVSHLFDATGLFLYFPKDQETSVFLMFSRGTEISQVQGMS